MIDKLLKLYEGSRERVGFVLDDGAIIEVENICSDKENGFEVKGEDLLRHYDRIVATWHTHPGQSANLSVGDQTSFLNYPEWIHHIIGSDGVSTYKVQGGKVICVDASISTEP